MTQDKEQAIIAACRHGDVKAMRQLYELHAPFLLAVAVRYLGTRDGSEDVLQESFVRIFSRIGQYEERGSVRAWMSRIVANESLQYLRKSGMYSDNISVEDLSEETPGFRHPMVDEISANELLECVAELPERYRTVFNLFAIEDYTHREIARLLHIEENASRTMFYRARKILQKKVAGLTKR